MHNFIIFYNDSLVLNSNYTVHVILFLIVLDQMREDRSQSSVDFSLITVQLIHGPNSSRWCRPCNNYLTNRFHVAVRLFSNRSQMTSKCGKNKKVAHEAIAECVTDVLTTF